MIRKAIIVVLMISASFTLYVWFLGTVGIYVLEYGRHSEDPAFTLICSKGQTGLTLSVPSSDAPAEYSIQWSDFRFTRLVWNQGRNHRLHPRPYAPLPSSSKRMLHNRVKYLEVEGPRWAVFVLFALLGTYPTLTFIRGPLRRYRRRRKGLCVNCGYNLTGNTSGICPECGAKLES